MSEREILNVGIVEETLPFVFACGRRAGVKCRYPGTSLEIFLYLANMASLLPDRDFRLIPLTTNYTWGSLKNGSFNGYMSLLQDGTIDLLLGPLAVNKDRKAHFDYMKPLGRMGMIGLDAGGGGAASHFGVYYSFLNVFEADIWMCILASLAALFITSRLERIVRGHRRGILLAFTAFGVVIFMNLYKSSLLTAYIIPRRPHLFTALSTLADRVRRNQTTLMIGSPSAATASFLQNCAQKSCLSLLAAIQTNPPHYYYKASQEANLDLLESGRGFLMTTTEELTFQLQLEMCQPRIVQFAQFDMGSRYFSFISRRHPSMELFSTNSTLSNDGDFPALSHAKSAMISSMNSFIDRSLFDELREKYAAPLRSHHRRCAWRTAEAFRNINALSLDNVAGVFLIYFVAVAMSVAICAAEKLQHHLRTRNRFGGGFSNWMCIT